MNKKTFTERELVESLDAESTYAHELATLLPHELTLKEWLKGLVFCYERPTNSVWDEWFESDERASRDFIKDFEQTLKDREQYCPQ